jgi:primosomal protein N' (replication factor Y) (superfamily II helicase)
VHIVRVLPDVRAVPRRFDYTVPQGWDDDVTVGTRVRVELHGRRVGGWVVEDGVEPTPGLALKPLAKLSGLGPPRDVVALAEWAAWRWAGPVAPLLTTASPDRVVLARPPRPPERVALAVAPGAAVAAPVAELLDTALGASLAVVDRPVLWRVPPDSDLLPIVEAVAARVEAPLVVLVPSTGWAERLRGRLARRGWPATGEWSPAAAGWPIVVGARAGAFAPVPALGAALVLDSHDEAYREERSPRFDAALVLAERARRAGAPCLWVSPCPTATQVAVAALSTPSRSAERAGWPVLTVVDRRAADPRTGWLSAELVDLARRVLPAGRLLIVLNRTGRARLLACKACGELARCAVCGRAVERVGDEYACRRCQARRPVVCSACGSTKPKVLRPGVSGLRDEVAALLGVAVGEVAGPEAEPVPDAPVLVGTQAVLHRVRRAAAVAFVDFDQHLLAPRLGAADEALALLARAGRLVGGRGAGGGSVLVQTRLPDHEVLAAAVHGDPARVSDSELALRRQLGLPPASALATLGGPGAAALAQVASAAGVVEASELAPERWLLRAPDHAALCDALAAAERPKERVNVTVDPTDL